MLLRTSRRFSRYVKRRGNGGLAEKYCAYGQLEQGKADAPGHIQGEKVQDAVSGKSRQVQDAGNEDRRLGADLTLLPERFPDLFLCLGKLVAVELGGDVPVQRKRIRRCVKDCF
jgi:hypothetical protein